MNDRTYLKLNYLMRLGEVLDLDHPKTLQAKLQKHKILYKNDDRLKLLADKYRMRSFLEEIGMSGYLSEIYFIGSLADLRALNTAPANNAVEYCVKLSNDCGSFFVARSGSNFRDVKDRVLRSAKLKNRFVRRSREYQYSLPPLVIMEKKIEGEIFDYKFWVFNGRVELLQYCKGEHLAYYDGSGQELDIKLKIDQWGRCHPTLKLKPNNELLTTLASEAQKIATHLNLPFVRVDFIVGNNEIYISELTFSPSSGLKTFISDNHSDCLNARLGNILLQGTI